MKHQVIDLTVLGVGDLKMLKSNVDAVLKNKGELPTCKTCKWWKTGVLRVGSPDACCAPHIVITERMPGIPEGDTLYVDPDDPFCTPVLHPAPDFGCVHWEKK